MDYRRTDRTSPTRSAHRISYDRDLVHQVLDEALVCHLGFVVDGAPVVLPQLHVRVDDVLYLHGSTGARALRTAAAGALAVCATVTLVDGVVLARAAMHHSMNYRSVVAHGYARPVVDAAEKARVLTALVEHVAPGRSAGTRAANRRELAATAVLALDLDEVSAKVRTGPPDDDDDDLDLPFWAGVVPLHTVTGRGVPAPGLTVAEPEHVVRYAGRGR